MVEILTMKTISLILIMRLEYEKHHISCCDSKAQKHKVLNSKALKEYHVMPMKMLKFLSKFPSFFYISKGFLSFFLPPLVILISISRLGIDISSLLRLIMR